jgi:hypothetical protein
MSEVLRVIEHLFCTCGKEVARRVENIKGQVTLVRTVPILETKYGKKCLTCVHKRVMTGKYPKGGQV